MSHFVVLVFGDPEDLEKQLFPFDENLEVDPYWVDECTDMTEHWMWKILSEEMTTPVTTMEEFAEELNRRWQEDGEKYRVHDGVLQRRTTYPPNAKWDWWTIGGRWSDMLKRHDLRYVNEGYIKDIDWDGMRADVRRKAEDDWDLMWNIIGEREKLVGWKTFLEKYPDDIPRAREEYNAQETLKVLRSSNIATWGCPVEIYHLDAPDPRTSYIESRVNAVPGCYAMLKDGQWVTKGEMGWWGMSKDDMTDNEWAAVIRKTIDDNPDEYITVVDCHI